MKGVIFILAPHERLPSNRLKCVELSFCNTRQICGFNRSSPLLEVGFPRLLNSDQACLPRRSRRKTSTVGPSRTLSVHLYYTVYPESVHYPLLGLFGHELLRDIRQRSDTLSCYLLVRKLRTFSPEAVARSPLAYITTNHLNHLTSTLGTSYRLSSAISIAHACSRSFGRGSS